MFRDPETRWVTSEDGILYGKAGNMKIGSHNLEVKHAMSKLPDKVGYQWKSKG